ncbi:amidohydrolase family protein [Mycolicibacterium brisbanense]|uniref:Amidohydrolase n=1 Tax=Mycolicibacterium brisbanense TaxID=146020 RepID=A0A117I608_9MYCO|nr:amidohydrolase family protein [Mycolicibacterium brisbanense]MCV7161816.1 amidohydrolase [Mycolicibacterium brisbanense]GAS89327.1 amidohydrolase [Mycolicibacterium brisbanense]
MSESESVRQIWSSLGLPGMVDVHTHFMPKNVMDKVWQYFDAQGPMIGREWPITYRAEEAERVAVLRSFGVRRFSSLVYPHKPDMAAWLNQWAAGFAADTPDCLATATFYPEPDAPHYVADAIKVGTQVFKAHIQVGRYDPNDPLLTDVWAAIEEAQVPVIIHCGSGPVPGEFTGPLRIEKLLARHPRLALIIAHMGMPEYSEFLDIAERFDNVRLDTTMAFTPFVESTMPFPRADAQRLLAMGDRILFGSDFPNIPYSYLDAIRTLTDLPGVDDTWLRNVLHDNAARLFGLT